MKEKLEAIITKATKDWYEEDRELNDPSGFAAGVQFLLPALIEALRQRDVWAEDYFKDSQLQELAATAIEIENTLILLELGSRE